MLVAFIFVHTVIVCISFVHLCISWHLHHQKLNAEHFQHLGTKQISVIELYVSVALLLKIYFGSYYKTIIF